MKFESRFDWFRPTCMCEVHNSPTHGSLCPSPHPTLTLPWTNHWLLTVQYLKLSVNPYQWGLKMDLKVKGYRIDIEFQRFKIGNVLVTWVACVTRAINFLYKGHIQPPFTKVTHSISNKSLVGVQCMLVEFPHPHPSKARMCGFVVIWWLLLGDYLAHFWCGCQPKLVYMYSNHPHPPYMCSSIQILYVRGSIVASVAR